MNTWTLRASRMMQIRCGSDVAFTVAQRTRFGRVVEVRHDHFRIVASDGSIYTILKEKVEALTTPLGKV
jgi:hypothetical protein